MSLYEDFAGKVPSGGIFLSGGVIVEAEAKAKSKSPAGRRRYEGKVNAL
jgi:hypothetical protein